jgi:CO/xanthine dehydrogenase FAD-binding subunit
MILEYQRPKTIKEALQLLNRSTPPTRPLAGGTLLNCPGHEPVALVDLQALGLDSVEQRGNLLRLGAMVRLQTLLEATETGEGLKEVIRHETPLNLRQAATIAGTAAAADGRSPLLAALLALDAGLEIRHAEAGTSRVDLGDWLPVRGTRRGELITALELPQSVRLAYRYVARTPQDLPIIGVVVARWPAGRTRVALCGWGNLPWLALDGPEPGGLEAAVSSAASDSSDAWASSEYRQAMAALLARRALEEIYAGTAGGDQGGR